jgi:hypothetical protein
MLNNPPLLRFIYSAPGFLRYQRSSVTGAFFRPIANSKSEPIMRSKMTPIMGCFAVENFWKLPWRLRSRLIALCGRW